MLNKDKRSLCLLLILGDGCLHYHRQDGKIYGGITIDHGLEQADYQSWKAKLLSKIFEKEVRMRQGHKGKSIQVSICKKSMRSWRRFIYRNNKKEIQRILPFIKHPELALAVWLMDDGYVEPSTSKLADGRKVNYGARFRIFTNSQDWENQLYIKQWLDSTFGTDVKIKTYYDKKYKKDYHYIKYNQADSLKIWETIRPFVLQFKSMRYKFRHIEQIYQNRVSQCEARSFQYEIDDIVRHS
jgi:hypothetical protein